MAQSQPIPFDADSSLSHSSANAPFNPASYTRAFFGSPMSLRTGSFGNRYLPGSSPGHFLTLDPTGKLSSSVESDRGSILNALNAMDREDELCRNYTCCGLNLQDLHALVDHFEECHVVVVDPYSQTVPPQPSQQDFSVSHPLVKNDTYFPPPQQPQQLLGSFDPDDMELDLDSSPASSSASSPPLTPITTPLAPYTVQNPFAFSQPSSACPSPVSAFETATVLPSRASSLAPFSSSQRHVGPDGTFNAFSGFPEYSAVPPLHVDTRASASQPPSPFGCVTPALLYGSTPASTPSTSRVASPVAAHTHSRSASHHSFSPQASTSASATSPTASSPTSRASTTLSRPASSLLLSKPFRCPKPNCNKSYKQANGLKYHMTHGSCNFAPPKDLEALQALLAEKGVVVSESSGTAEHASGLAMSEGELREVEREAERRLRPFACGVGDCQRRYKNMNGLRYHYQHSGDHGAIGLQLLASGQHECLQHNKTALAARQSTTPTSPTRSQALAPSNQPGQWQNTQQPPQYTAAAFNPFTQSGQHFHGPPY